MQNSGETFHLLDLGSILLFELELTLTHQFICILTKRNLKPFHYHKRAISQLERMFLQTAIHLGQPALSSQVTAGLSHWEAALPTQSPAAPCSPEAQGPYYNCRTSGSSYWSFHCCQLFFFFLSLNKKYSILGERRHI